jgi:NAD(P)-dependent dehydrogenase (short-subunit alcohol dehydrogenase family)
MNTSTALATKQKVCLIVGAGDATGSAIAKRFAQAGFTVCVTRRTPDASAALVQSSGGILLLALKAQRMSVELPTCCSAYLTRLGTMKHRMYVAGDWALTLLIGR